MKHKNLKKWRKWPALEIMGMAEEMKEEAERMIINESIKGEPTPWTSWTDEEAKELQKALWSSLVKHIKRYVDEWGYIAIRKETKKGKIKTWKLDLYDVDFPKVSVIEVETDPDIIIK